LGLTIEGACIAGILRNLPNDVGTYSVFQSELEYSAPNGPGMCPLTVELTRYGRHQAPLVPGGPSVGFYEGLRVTRSVEVEWVE
jgi:hypothetical protein